MNALIIPLKDNVEKEPHNLINCYSKQNLHRKFVKLKQEKYRQVSDLEIPGIPEFVISIHNFHQNYSWELAKITAFKI